MVRADEERDVAVSRGRNAFADEFERGGAESCPGVGASHSQHRQLWRTHQGIQGE